MCFNCFACISHRLALDLWLAKARRPTLHVILKKKNLINTVTLLFLVFVSPVHSDVVNFSVMENSFDV